MIAIALAFVAPLAFADDNSMSVLTGESYAYFNHLDYHAGAFNTPRRPGSEENDAVVQMPQKSQERAQQPTLLAERPRILVQSPFSDDKGA
jgi:hypothetical protein